MVLICRWILTPTQSSEETGHSNIRWEYQESYLIHQGSPRKAYVKAMEELNSLSSWEAHHNVLGRSFPQDVWNRWFNHFKFRVLVMWLQRMPSLLTTTTTGTFHNPNEQHVYHTLLTESGLSPDVLSQGNLLVSLICNHHELQHNRVYLPVARTACASLSGHPCISALINFHLRRTTYTQHTKVHRQNFMVYCSEWFAARGGCSPAGKSDHPLRGPIQKSATSIKTECNRFIKLSATGQMGCASLARLPSGIQNHFPNNDF